MAQCYVNEWALALGKRGFYLMHSCIQYVKKNAVLNFVLLLETMVCSDWNQALILYPTDLLTNYNLGGKSLSPTTSESIKN